MVKILVYELHCLKTPNGKLYPRGRQTTFFLLFKPLTKGRLLQCYTAMCYAVCACLSNERRPFLSLAIKMLSLCLFTTQVVAVAVRR